jgi:hypothetical protein
MRSMLAGRARRYAADAGRAVERAPVEVAILVVLAVAFSWAIELDGDAMTAWLETAIAGALMLAAAWTGTLLHAFGAWSAVRRWVVTLGGAAAAGMYAFLVLDLQLASEGWRAAMLLGAAVLWLVSVPVLAGPAEGSVDRVRAVTGRVLLRAIGAVLYCAALYLGLALAIGAINTLFELKLDGTIYGHFWGWIFLVLAPWIVIGGLDEYVQPVQPRQELAGVVHRMTVFLVPPLVALYFAILYAYTVRIGITGEVPKNLISPLVFAAGVLGTLALFLFDPRPADAPASRALRAAPPLFLPLAALGTWTVLLRVDQYGWTEFRLLRLLLLLALGLLALGATIQLVRRQRFALHAATLGLCGLLLLSAVGPWSVLAASRRSQQGRLERALVEARLDPSAMQAHGDTTTVPVELYEQVSSTTQYLAEHFGVQSLPPLVAAQVPDAARTFDVAARLGLRREPVAPTEDQFVARSLGGGAVVLAGGTSVRRVSLSSPPRQRPAPNGVTAAAAVGERVIVVQDSMLLRMRAGGEVLMASIAALMPLLAAETGVPVPDLPPEAAALDVTDAAGELRGSLLILSISLQVEGGMPRVVALDGLLLLDR